MIFVWYVVTNSRNHIQCLETRRIAFLKKNIIAPTNSVWLLLVRNLISLHIIVFYSRSFVVAAEPCLVPKFVHTFSPFTVLLQYIELIWRFTKKVNELLSFFSCVGVISSIGLNWSRVFSVSVNGKLTSGWHDCLDRFYISLSESRPYFLVLRLWKINFRPKVLSLINDRYTW